MADANRNQEPGSSLGNAPDMGEVFDRQSAPDASPIPAELASPAPPKEPITAAQKYDPIKSLPEQQSPVQSVNLAGVGEDGRLKSEHIKAAIDKHNLQDVPIDPELKAALKENDPDHERSAFNQAAQGRGLEGAKEQMVRVKQDVEAEHPSQMPEARDAQPGLGYSQNRDAFNQNAQPDQVPSKALNEGRNSDQDKDNPAKLSAMDKYKQSDKFKQSVIALAKEKGIQLKDQDKSGEQSGAQEGSQGRGSEMVKKQQPKPRPVNRMPGAKAVDAKAFNQDWSKEQMKSKMSQEKILQMAKKIQERRDQSPGQSNDNSPGPGL